MVYRSVEQEAIDVAINEILSVIIHWPLWRKKQGKINSIIFRVIFKFHGGELARGMNGLFKSRGKTSAAILLYSESYAVARL